MFRWRRYWIARCVTIVLLLVCIVVPDILSLIGHRDGNNTSKSSIVEAAGVYTPTSGTLVTGSEKTIVPTGGNVGSWRGTIAADGFSWDVDVHSSNGLNQQLIFGNVQLSGANKMVVAFTGGVVSGSVTPLYQICDWVSSSNVDTAADAYCTTGGWRTMNKTNGSTRVGISGTSNTNYYTLYDGYWTTSLTGNTAVSTPLSNFINGSNQVRIRAYSATGSTSVNRIDAINIYTAVHPLYSAGGFTAITSGTVSTSYVNTQAPPIGGTLSSGSDDVRLSVPGTGSVISDFYLSHKNIKTYPNANAIVVRAEVSCSSATAPTYKPKIYNFSTAAWEDLSSGSITCSTTDAVHVFTKSPVWVGDYVRSGELRVGWYAASASTVSIRVDYQYVMVGSVVDSTSNCEITLGTGSISDCLNTQNYNTVDSASTWSLPTELESTSMSDDYFGNDNDADDTSGEAVVAGSVKIPVNLPANALPVGLWGATAVLSGSTSVGVQVSRRQFGRNSNNQSGWFGYLTDTSPISSTTTVYRDSTNDITLTYPSIETSFFDETNVVQLRISTVWSGATSNVTATADLLFVAPAWIELSDPRPMAQYSYVPTGGQLVTGTEATINAIGYTKTSETKKTSSDGLTDDLFGTGVDIYGDRAVVGANDDKVGTQNKQGSAYVFGRDTGGAGTWGEIKRITASDGAAVDYFGNAVSMDGDVVAVGAYGDNGAASDEGSAYVYYKDTGGTDNWGQVKKVVPSITGSFYQFGIDVSLLGNILAVGASGETVSGNASRGAVYVFYKDTGGTDNWGEVKRIQASDGAATNRFGIGVDMYGDRLVVGANGNASNRGALYVYGKDFGGTDNWGEIKKLTASDGATGHSLGSSVTMVGDYIAAGAPAKTSNQGAVYIFYRHSGGVDNWGQVKMITASDATNNFRFGDAVKFSPDGTLLYVGAAMQSSSGPGAVYVFSRDLGGQNNWGQLAKIVDSDGATADAFGTALGVSATEMIAGAYLDDVSSSTDRGSAVIYTIANTAANNVGSWRGTIGAENGTGYNWTVTSHSSNGLNQQLKFDGVTQNGANKMIVSVNAGAGSSSLSRLYQICDWVSSSSVDSSADAQCTGGGWRTLNKTDGSTRAGIAETTQRDFEWQIYDGYWTTTVTGNTAVSTPLSNFISADTNKRVLIRAYSASAVAVTHIWNSAHIKLVVDPVYFAGDMTIGAGTVSGSYINSANPPTLISGSGGATGSDNVYFGSTGTASVTPEFTLKYKNIKNYTSANAVLVRAEYGCSGTGINITPQIRRFSNSTWTNLTGATIACSTTDATAQFVLTGVTLSDYISSDEIWIRWVGSGNSTVTIRVDYQYIMVGSVNSSTTSCEISLGTGTASNCSNTRDYDSLSTPSTWAGTSEDMSAISTDFYGYDGLPSALGYGVAMHVPIPIDTGTNSFIAGFAYAAAFRSNSTSMTLQPQLRDYNSYTAYTMSDGTDSSVVPSTGGFRNFGTSNASSTYTYSDSITNGIFSVNNTNYFDVIGDTTVVRFRTSSGSASATNDIDFVMIAPQYIEAPTISSITFAIDDTVVGFGALNPSTVRYATGDAVGTTTEAYAHTLTASTTASYGYTLSVNGTTLTSGANTVNAIGGTPVVPSAGTEQFGMRLTRQGGVGEVTAPYDVNTYALDTGAFPDTVATATVADPGTTYRAYYAASVDSGTSTGSYTGSLTYTLTPNF